jgi:hypothetical protein
MYLLVRFTPAPSLDRRTEDAPGRLVVGGSTFHEISTEGRGGPFLGFYDWIRTSGGRVVGLNLTFHDGREDVQRVLRQAGVGTWLTPDVFRAVFDGTADIDEGASVDQEFSVSRCYLDPEGQVALLFDASELTDDDCRALTTRA